MCGDSLIEWNIQQQPVTGSTLSKKIQQQVSERSAIDWTVVQYQHWIKLATFSNPFICAAHIIAGNQVDHLWRSLMFCFKNAARSTLSCLCLTWTAPSSIKSEMQNENSYLTLVWNTESRASFCSATCALLAELSLAYPTRSESIHSSSSKTEQQKQAFIFD